VILIVLLGVYALRVDNLPAPARWAAAMLVVAVATGIAARRRNLGEEATPAGK
jgi:hypothetical protein